MNGISLLSTAASWAAGNASRALPRPVRRMLAGMRCATAFAWALAALVCLPATHAYAGFPATDAAAGAAIAAFDAKDTKALADLAQSGKGNRWNYR